MNQTFHNRSGTDAEMIATLTAISQVSARMAKNLKIIAAHRQSEQGETVNVKNERYVYDIDTVNMTIYQPRRQNISTYEISKDDLYQWTDETLKPTTDLSFAGDGNFLCGEWFGFCKAKHECRARAEANLLLAQHDFKLPPLLEDSEIEVILSHVDELVSWTNNIKEYALQQAISGKEWTGWKLVEGRSNRRYTSKDAVSKAVKAAGFDPYEKKLLGITAMQKLLGKDRFEELLAAYIEKPQGKPTLVPESDKRPAMNTAKNDFTEEYDNE